MLAHRTLGPSGLRVSAMGLGCMSMSDDCYGDSALEKESLATIARAIELGVNFFDTADAYGPFTNEELLGRALRMHRQEVVLATKFGLERLGEDSRRLRLHGDEQYIRRACESSLRRLGLDYIDLYYAHRSDPRVPIEVTVGTMADLVYEGKVRYLGLCEATAETLRRAAAVHPIAALQSEWSLWSRDIENSVVPVARELGIGIVPYSPLGRGFLTGAITSAADLEEGDVRLDIPRFQGDSLDANLRLVQKLRELAADKCCTPGQLALAWVVARGDDVVPIPGTRRRKYLEENVGALDVVLSDDDLTRIELFLDDVVVTGDRYGDMRNVALETPAP